MNSSPQSTLESIAMLFACFHATVEIATKLLEEGHNENNNDKLVAAKTLLRTALTMYESHRDPGLEANALKRLQAYVIASLN